jgi:hypothetical protein
MQRKFWMAAIVIAVVIALALPLANFVTPAAADEPHPVIHSAIDKVQSARDELVNDASHDFHGHRAKAVAHLDEALKELHLALESTR